MHEASLNLTIRAHNTDHLPREAAELFWLAQVLTGDDDAAIACVLMAINSRTALRRTVIEAACEFLSSEITRAALEFSDEICFSDLQTTQTIGFTLSFETLRMALLKMNVLPRLVWVLRLAEGYSTMETATLLHVQPSAVRRALAAAAVCLASIFQSKS